MAILKVARMGHPVLRQKAREVQRKEIGSPELERLIEDMIETMKEYTGIGLAAPQVHHSIRLALIEIDEENPRYPEAGAQPLGVYINPKLTVLEDKEQAFWEGCLSVPELRGLVHRPRKILVEYLDRKGKPRELEAEGFLATVFQHEFDHLDGVLYVDRIKDPTKLAFLEEYRRYHLPEQEAEELPD
jgi:peptide deformylase